ncbi:type II toxin-antitoxin system VapC family toxin [Mycobacterium celatum]|uniref:Ribonuclease VapC n=1 Tax=Mycobacterium celatum TaxID=28045 RepID=A0A1X1RLE9_MYCCE|nr:type II toxin-antitoxin system VapC family toxin [Mycobacterium celatum]ORV08604.1 ribonuclease [Mycobacterium celatum]PIB78363.1 PIN domain-containing protein [Mycobacterium celatum]
MRLTYLDSSGIVKLVDREAESAALRRYLRRRTLVSSALARTEVLRAAAAKGDDVVAHGRQVLKRIDLVRINNRVISAAATILPTELRTLDAVHLATAQQFRDDLREIVTYDVRMAEAAELLGFRVTAPR